MHGWKNIGRDHSRAYKVIKDLIDDEQRNFRAGRVWVDQIFTLKQIGEKAHVKKYIVYGFYVLEECI